MYGHNKDTLLPPEAGSDADGLIALGFDVRGFVLSPPREVLYERIDRRVEAMAEGGLFEEAASLAMRGVRSGSSNASRAVGYRQALELLELGVDADVADIGAQQVQECLLSIMAATRRLASSQLSWHRNDTLQWYWHSAEDDTVSVAEDIVRVCSSPRDEPTAFDADLSRVTKEELQRLRRFPPQLEAFRDEASAEKLAERVRCLARAIKDGAPIPDSSAMEQ